MSVNLSKGQKISLEKEAGGALSQIKMGLGWDVGAAPQKSGGFWVACLAVAAAQAAALTWMRRVSCLMPTNKWWMRFGLDNCSQKTVAYNTQAIIALVLVMAMTK